MEGPLHTYTIGLGSNLGNGVENLERALRLIGATHPILRRSSLYRSRPWGEPQQPDFVNAAARFQSPLLPQAQLRELKELEHRLGRRPSRRWGPRTVDLDILLCDDDLVDDPLLTIPHAELHRRAFALVPLLEIEDDPGAMHPRLRRPFRELLEALTPDERLGVERIDPGAGVLPPPPSSIRPGERDPDPGRAARRPPHARLPAPVASREVDG